MAAETKAWDNDDIKQFADYSVAMILVPFISYVAVYVSSHSEFLIRCVLLVFSLLLLVFNQSDTSLMSYRSC